jgi:hypothetical protein
LPRPDGPAARSREIFIVHATAGLLLCSRGKYKAVHYYVCKCNPVTCQWVALPEPPWLPAYLSGLLSVITNGDGSKRFQVVLFNHPRFWDAFAFADGSLDLMVFSSASGQWVEKRILPPIPIVVQTYAPPFLGQSGTAYWLGYMPMTRLIAYNCLDHTVQVLPVPSRVEGVEGTTPALNRCIGERKCGGLRYAHFDCSVFQVWDLQTGGVDGTEWELVHQVDVMELAERNPEATAINCY